jgi:hypothetical protein
MRGQCGRGCPCARLHRHFRRYDRLIDLQFWQLTPPVTSGWSSSCRVGYLPLTGRARSFHGALGIWVKQPMVAASCGSTLGNCSYPRRAFAKPLFRSGSLLPASAFPRNSIALAAGALEFVGLSSRVALPRAFHSVPGSASFSTASGLVGSVPPAIGVTSTLAISPTVQLTFFPT